MNPIGRILPAALLSASIAASAIPGGLELPPNDDNDGDGFVTVECFVQPFDGSAPGVKLHWSLTRWKASCSEAHLTPSEVFDVEPTDPESTGGVVPTLLVIVGEDDDFGPFAPGTVLNVHLTSAVDQEMDHIESIRDVVRATPTILNWTFSEFTWATE